MEYTVLERDNENLIKIFDSDSKIGLILSKENLQKALLLLNALSSNKISTNDLMHVDTCEQYAVETTIPNIGYGSVSHAPNPHHQLINQPVQAPPSPPTPRSSKPIQPKVDMNKVKRFLQKITNEQKRYDEENEDIKDKSSAGGIAETAIIRAIKDLKHEVDKNTMAIALRGSAIGMDRDLFEITYHKANMKETEDYGDDD